jgi:YVTN family beta-propeller protein
MRPIRSYRPALAWTSLGAILLVVVLLAGVLPSSRPGSGSASSSTTATWVKESATPAGHVPPVYTLPPIGHVVESPLLDYNTTIPGNFGSSVWDWSIGPGTVVPATGEVWLSDNFTQAFNGPLPPSAPAILYDPTSNSFVGTVPQLSDTSDLLFDSANGLIYSTDPANNTVGVFNPTTSSWIASIGVGVEPNSLALDANNSTLYVGNSGTDTLSLINTTSGTVESRVITVAQSPVGLAFDSAHSQLFVACSGSAQLYVVRTTTNLVKNTVPLTADAGGVAVSESAGTVAVTLPSSGKLTVLYTSNLAVITSTLSVGIGSHEVVATPNGNEFVIANSPHAHLVTVNASAATIANASISVGDAPIALIPDGNTGMVYSWSPTFRNLTPVDAATGESGPPSPSLGVRVSATAFNPSTNQVIVADALTHELLILNGTTFDTTVSPIPLSSRPYALADNPSTSIVYVGLNGSIASFDTLTDTFTGVNATQAGPNSALAVDGPDGLLWDMNNVSGLKSFELANLTPGVSTTIGPDTSGSANLALDPTSDQLFAITTTGSGSELAVVAASTGLTVNAGIDVGPNLTSIAYDSADGEIYALGSNLTMVNATTLLVDSEPVYVPHHIVFGASIVYEPSREFLYATTSAGPGTVGEVTAIDGSSVIASLVASGTIYLGYTPTALLSVNYPGADGVGSGVIVAANWNSGSLGVIATSPALINYLTASPDVFDLGQSTHILLQYLGGAGIVGVTFTGLPSGCASLDTTDLDCTPTVSGTFTVDVTLTDALGNVYEANTTFTVLSGLAVSAQFTAASFPQLDPGYSFTALGNATGGEPAYSYSWSFGDGTSAQGSDVSHSYSVAGSYALTLTVHDNLGAAGTATWAVLVNPSPSTAASDSASVVDVNHSLAFNSVSSGGTGIGVTNWNFGDGTTGSGGSTEHAWSKPGTYLVNVTYHDSLGIASSASLSVVVNPSLTGKFAVVPPSGVQPIVGTTLQFNATALGGTSPYVVLWDFGDGSTSTGPSVGHAYASAGNYTVLVTETDRTGATLNGTLAVSIAPSPATHSASSSSTFTFPLGLFLGVLAGAALAAVVVYAVGPRRPKDRSPPSPSPPAPVPVVPPAQAEWKED